MHPLVSQTTRAWLFECASSLYTARVKGGMSLRNDIIMRNLKYGKWHEEINQTGKHSRVSATRFLFLAPNWRSNRFASPFITATKTKLKPIPILDNSLVIRFQNKLKRFFTHVSPSVKHSESSHAARLIKASRIFVAVQKKLIDREK